MENGFDRRSVIIACLSGWICTGIGFFKQYGDYSFWESLAHCLLLSPLAVLVVMLHGVIAVHLVLGTAIFYDKELQAYIDTDSDGGKKSFWRLCLRIVEIAIICCVCWVVLKEVEGESLLKDFL